VKLIVAHDPAAPYDKAVHALTFKQVRNLKLRNLEIVWEKPEYARWESALVLEDVRGLELTGFQGRQAPAADDSVVKDDLVVAEKAAVVLRRVENAVIRNCAPLPGTGLFFDIQGASTRDIAFLSNDFREPKTAIRLGKDVPPGAVLEAQNLRK
jgi:hypothetical protein